MKNDPLWIHLDNAEFLLNIRSILGFLTPDTQILIYDMILSKQIMYSPESRNQFKTNNVVNFDRYLNYQRTMKVDVEAPEYVGFVKGLKENIKYFAKVLKDLHYWTSYQRFSDIIISGDTYSIHKFLYTVKREAIAAYNFLMAERVKWKQVYKEKRKVQMMSKIEVREEVQEHPTEIKFLGSADYWKNHETMVHFVREALNYFSRAELLDTINRFSGDHEAEWESSECYDDLDWSASSTNC